MQVCAQDPALRIRSGRCQTYVRGAVNQFFIRIIMEMIGAVILDEDLWHVAHAKSWLGRIVLDWLVQSSRVVFSIEFWGISERVNIDLFRYFALCQNK